MFRRERLLQVLAGPRRSVCTWLEGPPGSGKTALLASFVNAAALDCLWYQVDAEDADPAAFFACMLAAARRTLGDDAARRLPPPAPEALFGPTGYARRFFAQLFDLAPNLTVVMDDYHEAPPECPLHDILRVAIEQAPAEALIAVASRSQAPPQLARLRISGVVQTVDWSHLELTADEVAGIAALHGMALGPQQVEHWRDRCGGWAAGLRLLLRPDASPDLRVAATGPRALLFDYLGQEVFCRLAPADQSLLLRLALLPRMLASVVGDLESPAAAERALTMLVRRNLFTTVSDEEAPSYSFHPLFREFLLYRARRVLSGHELMHIGLRAADALQARGLTEDAAQVLAEVEAWPQLAQLALHEAAGCMSLGRTHTLEQWLCALPAASIEKDPWLRYWLGASRAQRDPASARGHMERAFELFNAREDESGLLLAWAGVVDCIFYLYFDLTQLDPWIARLDAMDDAGLTFPSAEVEAKVSFSMFVALSFRQPQHPKFGLWRSRLEACAEAAPDPMFRLLSRLHLLISQIWSGDLQGAGAALQELRRESARRLPTPFVELVGHLSEATLALYAGEVESCFAAIDQGLAAAQGSGIHIWDKVMLGQGAALALSHGQVERGRVYADRRAASARAGDHEERSLYHAIEAWSSWLGGRPAEALARAKLCIDIGRRMGLPHFSAISALAMAVVSFECGDRVGGLEQVAAGRAIGVLTRNPMLEWMADLLESYMRLRLGEPAGDLIVRCMAAGRRHGYCHFFFWPRRAVAVVCLEALALGVEIEYVQQLIEKGRLPPPPEAERADQWPWPVKVYTLGRFVVLVHGTPLRFEGKAQRAPLNLLKCIVAHGGHDVAEARVIDDLWPDADGDAGEQALATTLSRLRKLIGAAAVRRQAGHLSLDDSHCWVDCQALQRWLLDPPNTASGTTYGNIKRLYQGDFLHGEGDAPWMLPLRERLHMALVKTLCRHGEGALSNRQADLAAEHFELGLTIDDLVEAFHAGLMRCHLQSGQPSLAAAAYQRCRRTLWNRLGVEPSEATRRLEVAARDAGARGRSVAGDFGVQP